MADRISKPRVFLSHSKADVAFIEQIYEDLRRCQIEPWLDSEEIRHGHPWLDAIFEDGLPACDCVLVYLTKDSINSHMVRKEIDASIIQKLKDNSISFLPYVNESSIRQELRADLQALQAPELNEGNYSSILPRIVAEIWRSYLERKVSGAIESEKVRRLEAELELEKIKSKTEASAFSDKEYADFEYIYSNLDRSESFSVVVKDRVMKKEDGKTEWVNRSTVHFKVNLSSLIPFMSSASNYELNSSLITELLKDNLKLDVNGGKDIDIEIIFENFSKLSNELLMYGFLSRVHIPPPQSEGRLFRAMHRSYKLAFTEKLEKYKYWMAFNGRFPSELSITRVSNYENTSK